VAVGSSRNGEGNEETVGVALPSNWREGVQSRISNQESKCGTTRIKEGYRRGGKKKRLNARNLKKRITGGSQKKTEKREGWKGLGHFNKPLGEINEPDKGMCPGKVR